jgi:hypothetical protein
MSIYHLENGVQPEHAERLNRAFRLALSALHLTDRGDAPICNMVAQKVVEIDATGVHDPEGIAKLAAKEFRPSKIETRPALVDACCARCVCSEADRRPNLRDALPLVMIKTAPVRLALTAIAPTIC